jgi:beta-glucosidase
VRSLKGIRHIDLDPGQSARVSFTLTHADLAFVHPDRRTFAEPGAFDVWIAPSSVGGVPATFVLA